MTSGEQLTLLPAESLASLSVWPGSRQAQQMTVTSGRRLLASLPSCDRELWWLKTLVASSAWHSTMCLLTWKHKATPAGRSYYQLAVSVPRIDGSEFGWWPTPTAIDATLTAEMKQGQKGRHAVQLSHLANSGRIHDDRWWLLPTPAASKAGNDLTLTCSGDGRQKPNKLGWAVAAMLPTPRARDANAEGFKSGMQRDSPTLPTVVKMGLLPTPTAGDGPKHTVQGGLAPAEQGRQLSLSNHVGLQLESPQGMKLNPAWVSRMQGFPDNWMELD